MVVKHKANSIWLGKPLGSNKHVNFFKTNSKDIPVNMFKDNDRDGVANAFDCSPNDKNKQGLIDAIVGAGKALFSKRREMSPEPKANKASPSMQRRMGADIERERNIEKNESTAGSRMGNIKRAWQEGMSAKGNPISRGIRRNYQQAREMQTERINAKYANMTDRQQQATIARRLKGPMSERVMAMVSNVSKTAAGTAGLPTSFSEAQRVVRQAHPNYAREAKLRYWKERLKNPDLTPQQKSKIYYQMAQAASVRATTLRKFRNAAIGMAFPMPSMQSYGSGSGDKTISGVPGRGRGRPRGSLDKRYAQYGGVFGYRRYVSDQKRALRIQFQRQQQMMKMNAQKQMPQYEQQQYQQQQQEQQLPPELQGQSVTPDYSQYQAQQAQYEQPQQVQQVQYPQQYQVQQQEPSPREIKTVFKGSGGSPYPPVPKQGLTPTRQTIQQGYVESVDLMTGRRFMKQLPQKERWS